MVTNHSTKIKFSSSAVISMPRSRASAPAARTVPACVYHRMEGILKSPFSCPGNLRDPVRTPILRYTRSEDAPRHALYLWDLAGIEDSVGYSRVCRPQVDAEHELSLRAVVRGKGRHFSGLERCSGRERGLQNLLVRYRVVRKAQASATIVVGKSSCVL